jgi:hypothetical protein
MTMIAPPALHGELHFGVRGHLCEPRLDLGELLPLGLGRVEVA